jgi:hypothetical protein
MKATRKPGEKITQVTLSAPLPTPAEAKEE